MSSDTYASRPRIIVIVLSRYCGQTTNVFATHILGIMCDIRARARKVVRRNMITSSHFDNTLTLFWGGGGEGERGERRGNEFHLSFGLRRIRSTAAYFTSPHRADRSAMELGKVSLQRFCRPHTSSAPSSLSLSTSSSPARIDPISCRPPDESSSWLPATTCHRLFPRPRRHQKFIK